MDHILEENQWGCHVTVVSRSVCFLLSQRTRAKNSATGRTVPNESFLAEFLDLRHGERDLIPSDRRRRHERRCAAFALEIIIKGLYKHLSITCKPNDLCNIPKMAKSYQQGMLRQSPALDLED